MRSSPATGYMPLTVILLLAVAICGCTSGGSSSRIGNGSFVFIEYHDTLRSKVIEGNVTFPLILDDPLYLYDEKNRSIFILFSAEPVRNSSGLKALYGETVDCPRGGAVAWGTAQYYLIDKVPASAGGMPFGSAGIVINDIKDDGTVSLTYRDTNITLKPGERWTGTWSNQEQFHMPGLVTLGFDRDEIITNHGIFNLSQVGP